MKKILGLDLGINTIGWSLIQQDFENKTGKILGMGCRILPLGHNPNDNLGAAKVAATRAAERTGFRNARKSRERHLLRRERLHRILNLLGFLPEHYAGQIDFKMRLGKFVDHAEPKVAYSPYPNKESFKKNKTAYDFIFKKSYDEMLADFSRHQPDLVSDEKKIPYDWTIYYLRKKALSQKIEKEELAWLLLNFNQKRGNYHSRGGEQDENPNRLVELHSLRIVEVRADKPTKNGQSIWYSLILENGWIYRRASTTPLFVWKDQVRDFIVTTEINYDGSVKTTKERVEKRSFRSPGDDDWALMKKKTEREIEKSGKTVGAFIYDALLKEPTQQIRGGLIRTIERKFYKEELMAILERQVREHPELRSENLYSISVRELYKNNKAQQISLRNKGFVHLFIEDIIFYQRPLKSKRSSARDCALEYRKFNVNGKQRTEYLKTAPRSHPRFQELRIWQWIYRLTIHRRDDDSNVTSVFLNSTVAFENLFEFLCARKDVTQDQLLKFLIEKTGFNGKSLTSEAAKYRWNFSDDKEKKYPCCETSYLIKNCFDKVANLTRDFRVNEFEEQLWHIIYSITDKAEYEKALRTFSEKHRLDTTSFVDNFKKLPPFKKEFARYSLKAIKKLLPLVRLGKYWDWEAIDEKTKIRIDKIVNGEVDPDISAALRERAKTIGLGERAHFQGLHETFASHLVYVGNPEAPRAVKWRSPDDLEKYLDEFRQYSLHAPTVERLIMEAIRVVKDIWIKYGNSTKDFFDEVHFGTAKELGTAPWDKERTVERARINENTDLRIKSFMAGLMTNMAAENIVPCAPEQQDKLRIYEHGVLHSNIEIPEDIDKISKSPQPTSGELHRYMLWMENNYRSPYTGKAVPLQKLFTSEYEIDHIIPQSRFFDTSFSNQVICESAVKKLKGDQLGLEFIKVHQGEIVGSGIDKTPVRIFDMAAYEAFVKEHYQKSRSQQSKLLMKNIPERTIGQQNKDNHYNSRVICSVLSNIVRAEKNDNGTISKNVITVHGKIAAALKQDWGLNDVWDGLVLPRFERMNAMTMSTSFTCFDQKYQKHLPTVPLNLSKGFDKKRIDHRHHALDALVIASATKDHVDFLNNQRPWSGNEMKGLLRKLKAFEKVLYFDRKTNEQIEKEVLKDFRKPWENISADAKNSLEKIVVSFKQNLRVIGKTGNKYESYKDEMGNVRAGKNGDPKKGLVPQKAGDGWTIRKPLHQETFSGKIILAGLGIPAGKILTATRKALDSSFSLEKIAKITDTGIQKILRNHLKAKDGNPGLAFSPQGIDEMNENIFDLNEKTNHQPVRKVRVYELGKRFMLGKKGAKRQKFVQSKEGTNLFYAVYHGEGPKRIFETIQLHEVIAHQKWRATLDSKQQQNTAQVPVRPENGRFIFCLSPNDLIYLPADNEIDCLDEIDFNNLSKAQIERLFNVNDFSTTCYFRPNHLSLAIAPKEVDLDFDTEKNKTTGSFDVKTATFEGKQIKDLCIKLSVDRLGDISRK